MRKARVATWREQYMLPLPRCGRVGLQTQTIGTSRIQIRSAKFAFDSPYWDEISNDAKDFIRRLLTKKPRDRMSAVEALQHPFLMESARESYPPAEPQVCIVEGAL